MKIFGINSAIQYNTNFKQRTRIANYIASLVATTAALSSSSANSEDFYRKKYGLFDKEEDIFDEQYYQDYYNIDLNLAKSRAFRDSELFNPLRDNENNRNYSAYDEDDVDLADNLKPRSYNEKFEQYDIINTDIGYEELPDCVKNPYKTQDKAFDDIDKKWLKRHDKYFLGENIDSDIKHNIIKASTRKYFGTITEIKPDLVKLGIDLYKNSGDWTETEDKIMDNVYKTSSFEMRRNIASVKTMLLANKYSNEEILKKFQKAQKSNKRKTSKP